MNRQELEAYLADTFDTPGETPWPKYPENRVFRHGHNKKWFAVIMDVPKTKLGFPDDRKAGIVNLKCDPFLIGSLLEEPGILPGWHMHKAHWISVLLDGTVDDEKIKFLIDISCELTGN